MTAANVELGMSGHFKLVATKPDGTERVLADFKNLILDAGIARLATGNGAQGYIQLGTGTTAPAASQTTLVNRVASFSGLQSKTNSYVAGPPFYSQCVIHMRANPGEATGTFSEIGIGWASAGSLFSRALILDGGGSPTTVTVLADEYLSVYYTFRLYPQQTDSTGTVVISGATYDVLTRCGYFASESANYLLTYGLTTEYNTGTFVGTEGTFGAAGTDISSTGGYGGSSAVSFAAVAGDSFSRDFIVTWPLTAYIASGVKYVRGNYSYFSVANSYKHALTPPIPKTNSQTMTLTTRVTLARYP